MISLISRALFVIFAYTWPAYQSFKALERSNADQTRKWCTYWVVLAAFSAVEVFCDYFLFWLPLYYIAKLVFVVLLWHPRFDLGAYVYHTHVRQIVKRNEAHIDAKLAETQAYMADQVSGFYSRALDYANKNMGQILMQLRNIQGRAETSGVANQSKKTY